MKRLKYTLAAALLISFWSSMTAQNIRFIAAYDNESSFTSGLYAVGDTAVYRYSWYYQAWFPLSGNGLNRHNDTVQIGAIAVYNNYSSNSSGIFVFSDTAVYNYNWITTLWYPLSNTGLPRINNKPAVRELAVYGEAGSSSNSTVFALTDTAVFRYSWFLQEWLPLSNSGLITAAMAEEKKKTVAANAYPNPFSEKLTIEVALPSCNNGLLSLAFFDMQGRLVHKETYETHGQKLLTIEPHTMALQQGMYFCEIYDGQNLKILKVFRVN